MQSQLSQNFQTQAYSKYIIWNSSRKVHNQQNQIRHTNEWRGKSLSLRKAIALKSYGKANFIDNHKFQMNAQNNNTACHFFFYSYFVGFDFVLHLNCDCLFVSCLLDEDFFSFLSRWLALLLLKSFLFGKFTFAKNIEFVHLCRYYEEYLSLIQLLILF